MGDLDEEERPKSNGRLEGNPPDRFTGDRNKTNKFLTVTLLGHFSFLLPFIPVLLLHLSHACVTPRPLGLASLLLGSLYFYFLGVDSL